MLAFFRRYEILLSSFFCLMLSLYILLMASRGHLRVDPIGPRLLGLVRPFQKGAQATILGLQGMRQGWAQRYAARKEIQLENENLRRRVMELEEERNRLLEAEATNRRLQKLLDLRAQLPTAAVSAAVIGKSASTWFQSLTIDKGVKDNIRKGMAVVSPAGAVGQIVSVAPKSAKVLLLTDYNSGVDVIVQRSRTRGIVAGSLEGRPHMKHVRRSEGVEEGDRLVTSGLDGIFPKGFLVGTVSEIYKKNYGLFQYVSVHLAVDPTQIEEVLVVSADAVPKE